MSRWNPVYGLVGAAILAATPAAAQEHPEYLDGPAGLICDTRHNIKTTVLANDAPEGADPNELDQMRIVLKPRYGLNTYNPIALTLNRNGKFGIGNQKPGDNKQLDALFAAWVDERAGDTFEIGCNKGEFGALPTRGIGTHYVGVKVLPDTATSDIVSGGN